MMATSGWSRPAASASAMPSMTGIFTSVSSRSNALFCLFNASSAATPSVATVNSWPSSLSARTTRSRSVSSSSATRILAISLFNSGVLRGEEAHHHVAGLGRRRGDLAAEFQPLAGTEDAAGRQHGPGIDFLSGCIARGEAQARHLDRFAGFAHDGAFHDQDADAVLSLLRNPDLLEFEIAQVDRQADGREQRSGLRQVTHHVFPRAAQNHVAGEQPPNDRGHR